MFEDIPCIVDRLKGRIETLSTRDDYILVGHSLGGVLIRAAVNSLPPRTRLPQHVFLLGSPMRPSRIATWLRRNWLFRAVTGDSGQLLSSPARMEAIGPISVPTTSIVGTRGINSRFGPFGNEPNDGVVSISEVVAPWISDQIEVAVVHSFLPASRRVAQAIVQRTMPSKCAHN